jgi:hypothetical protein
VEYDEAVFFATQWLTSRHAHELKFAYGETHDVRGDLMDELEDNFPFFTSRTSPRVWRDKAIRRFVTLLSRELMGLKSSRRL